MCTYTYTYMCTYTYTYMCTYMYTYMCAYIYTYMCTYTQMSLFKCKDDRCELDMLNTNTHNYIHTCTHTFVHTCIHTCVHTCIHTHRWAYSNVYIHVYIHTDEPIQMRGRQIWTRHADRVDSRMCSESEFYFGIPSWSFRHTRGHGSAFVCSQDWSTAYKGAIMCVCVCVLYMYLYLSVCICAYVCFIRTHKRTWISLRM